MRFELENRKDGPDGLRQNLDWLYSQDYKDGENHVTESLFKWFFFSRSEIQYKFLAEICAIKGKVSGWTKLNLQRKGRTGTPDAVLHFRDGQQVLFEIKIKEKSVSQGQLKRHLKDAGIKTKSKLGPILILITPDDERPRQLDGLHAEYMDAIRWVPWIRVMNFLSKRLKRDLHSSDRFLRDGLLILLRDDYLKRILP